MARKLRVQYPSFNGKTGKHKTVEKLEDIDEEALEEFRQSWLLGSEAFRRECLEQMEGKLGENHPGQLGHETAEAKADRLIAEELGRLRWSENDLAVSMPLEFNAKAQRRKEAKAQGGKAIFFLQD